MRRAVGVGVLTVFLLGLGCDGDGGGGAWYVAGPGIDINESTDEISADVGTNPGQVAAGDHDHDGQYVNSTGDTMTGDLTIEGSLTFATPKTRCYSIPPCSFMPSGAVAYRMNEERINCGAGSGSIDAFAPVHIPDGATITDFLVVLEDSNPDEYMRVWLRSVDIATGKFGTTVTDLSTAPASGTPGKTTLSATGLSHDVDNMNYTYQVWAYLPEDNGPGPVDLVNVRVCYTVTEPLP